METEEIINDLKKYELKHQETRSRLDFVVNDGTVLGWEEINTIINTVESLTKENEELSDNKAKAIRWAETEMRGRERMRKLYGQKIDEVAQLKAENKELREEIEDLESEACRVDDINLENTQLKARVKELEKGMKFIQSLEPKYFLGKYIDKLLTPKT